MDPQKLSQLDPKLRDAYQRVMGTPVPKPSIPPAQTQTPPPANIPTPPTQRPTIPVKPPITPNSNPNINPFPAIKLDEPMAKPIQPPTQPQTTIEPPAQPTMPPLQPQTPLGSANFDQLNSQVSTAPSSNFSTPTPMAQNQAVIIKKKNGLLPVLVVIVILVFLVVYSLFWVKVFNLKLPFLP